MGRNKECIEGCQSSNNEHPPFDMAYGLLRTPRTIYYLRHPEYSEEIRWDVTKSVSKGARVVITNIRPSIWPTAYSGRLEQYTTSGILSTLRKSDGT